MSAATTAGIGLISDMVAIMALRFAGGAASAFVIVCASTVVLEQLSAQRRSDLAAIRFAGVGAGIFVSAAALVLAAGLAVSWKPKIT